MPDCRACGAENPDRARFCLDCGIRLTEAQPAPVSSRRTVTILFTDIVGSTELGERLDPEALRPVLAEYFATMKASVERHAGTVEKFIGDAIMAVFGLGAIHEDDALRAVRAAAEMRDALAELNVDLLARRGISIATRTGLNTGEVVAGDPSLRQTMVTGDTVNTAARLEQAAGPGEILLGLPTWQLVRHAVTVERIPPLTAKGKAEPVSAVRLVSVRQHPDPQAASGTTPIVGRGSELDLMAGIFGATASGRVPALLMVLGPAGVGKSRLVAEFVASLADRATILHGRCLPYGEGVTYWPIREILHAAAGIQDRDRPAEGIARLRRVLRGVPDDSALAARLATAIGLSEASFTQEEIFWAVRRTVEHLAAAGPLVVVIDDIHWAEPVLLELIGHLVGHARGVPLLIVCPSRPEVLDRAPGELRDSPRVSTIRLEGLTPDATAGLINALPGGNAIPTKLRERILATVEGNPLFLEEMVRMVVEDRAATDPLGPPIDRADAVALPRTIQALLAARVDQLPSGERDVAQRASIVGREFEETAVVALTPPAARPGITADLLGLVQREVVAPARPGLSLTEAYRFRHILMRDAAYEALSKAERAELHRRFADWLEQVAIDRLMEYHEILGYHLGQSYRYRIELRENDPQTVALGDRAARHLGLAGKRASDRGDGLSAIRLLGQAEAMPSDDREARGQLLLDLGRALQLLGRYPEAGARADEAIAVALEVGDRRIAARARVLRLEILQATRRVVGYDPSIRSEVAAALVDAEASADDVAIADANAAMGLALWNEGDPAGSDACLRLALNHANAAGDVGNALSIELNLIVGVYSGPTPARSVVAEAMALVDRASDFPSIRADALCIVGISEAMLGHFEAGSRHVDESLRIMLDLANYDRLPYARCFLAKIHRLAGDPTAAEAVLRESLAEAKSVGDLFMVSFVSCELAVILVTQERYDEATVALAEAERSQTSQTRSRISGVRARIKASRGDRDAASDVAALLDMSDVRIWPNVRAEALRDAAYAMRSLGDRESAAAYALEGARLSREKENVALAVQLEEFAAAL